jgi:hypothetical protein
MKAIADFPNTIYFDDHILPMMSKTQQTYLKTKYAPFFQKLILPVLNKGYKKYYGKEPPTKYEPTLYELLTYELLPFDAKIMETLPQPIISPQVLMEVSAGNVPAGVLWNIDQIRMFARWLDSDRLEHKDVPYNAAVHTRGVDDSTEEHRHFRLRNYIHHD